MEKHEILYDKKPKLLRKVEDPGKGRIFTYTEALAKRSDMVPIWGENEQPPEPVKSASGLDVKGAEIVPLLHEQMREKDQIIAKLNRQIDALMEDNQAAAQEIHDLKAKLAHGENEQRPEAPPHDDLPDPERLSLLVEKTVEMIRNGDENDFTGQGKPRVERLEAWAGIAEVNSKERDAAFEQAKAQLED